MTGSINSVPEFSTALNGSPNSGSPPTPNTEYAGTPTSGSRQGVSLRSSHTRMQHNSASTFDEDYDNFASPGIFATPKNPRNFPNFGTSGAGSPAPRGAASSHAYRQPSNINLDHLNNVRLPTGYVPFKANVATQWINLNNTTPILRHGSLAQPFPAVYEEASQESFRSTAQLGSQFPSTLHPTTRLQPEYLFPDRVQDQADGLHYEPLIQIPTRHAVATPFFDPKATRVDLPVPIGPAQQGQPSKFRPMAALVDSRRLQASTNNLGGVLVDNTTFSNNYRGEHTMRNASAADLSEDQNCALWLTNLPPDVTTKELLACIRNIGRIWCTVINAPDYTRHITAAAKVVFFTPQPAQHLLTQSVTRGLTIRDHQVKVTRNRVKYREEALVGTESRVLIVTGKSTFVNEKQLTNFFRERFIFEIDEVRGLIENVAGRSVVEYKFGSYRCQAQMGKMALEKDKPEGFEKVEFGEDPCEVGDTLASYEVAGRRINGKAD